MATSENVNSDVAKAFDAVRSGDFSKTAALQELGIGIVDDLKYLLGDGNEDVRREAVVLLGTFSNARAASALIAVLDDDSSGIRDRAANAVLKHALKSGGTDIPALGSAIVSASQKGELSGSAILLLGYSRAGRDILDRALNSSRLVKTGNAGPAVPAGHPARLALARRGDGEVRAALESHFSDADVDTFLFTLDNIGIIDSPALLHALAAATLGNETPTGRGVPSGAEPSRRIMDEAVIAFTKRLSLVTAFDTEERILFEPGQIDTVKNLIASSIPQ